MTPDDVEEQHSAVQTERRRLVSLAFHLLGSLTDAEDVVQDSYISWYHMTAEEQEAVEAPQVWLTRTVGRSCLAILTLSHRGHDHLTDAGSPETPALGDHRTVTHDSEPHGFVAPTRLTPAQRVVTVLRERLGLSYEQISRIVDQPPAVCERLSDAARRKSVTTHAETLERVVHDLVVLSFAAAANARSTAALLAVLDPQVEIDTGRGGVGAPVLPLAPSAPVCGAEDVVRHLLAFLRSCPSTTVLAQELPDELGVALWDDGRLVHAAVLKVARRGVVRIRLHGHCGGLSQLRRGVGC